ncbi:hypothetical protein Dimus_006070 [Dionaea muscipula]
MSHFGRSGPPDIRDTYSLLVLNITFRTSADDLYPLFDKYGKVVDVFIPRDRRTGESRGFAFVRYRYQEEAQKAVERLDGKLIDGREIMVQFAKYGPNAERIHKGRIMESAFKTKARSRSPRPRYRDDYRDRDYRRSRSRSRDRYERDRYRGREKDDHHRSRSYSMSPDHGRDDVRDRYDNKRRSPSPCGSPRKSPPCRTLLGDASPDQRERSACGQSVDSRSQSPKFDADWCSECWKLIDLEDLPDLISFMGSLDLIDSHPKAQNTFAVHVFCLLSSYLFLSSGRARVDVFGDGCEQLLQS